MTIQQHASFDSSAAELNATSKLVKAWESKNAKNAAKAGGVSMMALSLAACGGSSTTTAVTTPVVETPVVDTPVIDASKAMALTTGSDILTGGSGDDTINGSATSLTADDVLNGSGGTDTLTLSYAGTGATVIPNATAIENIVVTNVGDTAALVVNLAAATGYEDLKLVNSATTGDVTFSGMSSLASLSHSGVGASAQTTAIFADALTKGTSDSITVNVADGSAIILNVGGVTATNEFETYNIVSSGVANTVQDMLQSDGSALQGASSTINISGAGDFTLGLATAAVDTGATSTVNASTATGDVTVYLDNLMKTVTLGAGDDTLDATLNQLEGDDTNQHILDGGLGRDTLVVDAQFDVDSLDNNTAGTTATATKNDDTITGFEVLQVKNDIAASATGHSDFAADVDTADFDTVLVTLSSAETTTYDAVVDLLDLTDEAVHFSSTEIAVTDDETTELTLDMKDASGASDSVTVSSVASAAATAHVNELTDLITVDTAISAIETLNLVADRADITSGGTTTVGTTINSIAAGNTTTLNITGSGGLTVNTVELNDPTGATSNAVINAADHSGNLTLAAGFKTTASDLLDITLGGGKNSIDFAAEGLSGDKVVGTTGTDTVKLKTSAADLEMTITDVDTLALYGVGATKVISLKNATVGEIDIFDTAAADDGTDDIKVTNLNQAVNVHSTNATNADWNGDTITLDMATGVTSLSVNLEGGVALEGTGVISTDATSVSVADSNVAAATGYHFDETLVIAGMTAGTDIATVTLTGGGLSAASTAAVFSLDGTSNVSLATVDATSLESDLDLNGVTTAAAAKVLLNATGQVVTLGTADVVRDAVDVTGGAGSDTIKVAGVGESATNSVFVGATAVENLHVTLAGDGGTEADFTVDMADAGTVAKVTVDVVDSASGSDHTEAVNVSNLVSGATVVLGGADTEGHEFAGSANKAVTINAASSGSTVTVTNGEVVEIDADADDADDEGLVLGANVAVATIKTGSAENFTIDELDAASLTTLTIGSDEKSATGAALAGAIVVTDATAAKLTTLNIDSNNGDITIGSGGLTAAKLTTLDIIGDNAVAIGDAATVTTLLADVNGDTATGAITFGTGVDFTAAADIKTGTGNDTVNLVVTLNTSTALDMGEKTSDSDTLNITGSNGLGVTVVDLSASDQITQLNGAADSAVQAGIENIDLSGLTGAQGSNITGSDDVNKITGTKNADVISAGKGADLIYGGDGDDVVTGGAGADQFRFDATDATTIVKDFTDGTDFIVLLDGASSNGTAVAFAGTTSTAAGVVLASTDVATHDVTDDSGFDTSHLNIADEGQTTTEINALDIDKDTAYLMVFNETTGYGELWYDADWDVQSGRTKVAQFESLDAVTEVTGLTAADFYGFIA